ncbi:MAG: MFS transporter [Oscillospiraceae bacterium]|jgi:OFA family oxalate/formate antiporter-like MFS transporter|nr:MFS transporter [Oscillospiraceae bacterium]
MPQSVKRWTIAANAIFLLLLLGLIYAWSNFVAPLEAEFGWKRAETSLAFTICMSCFCVGGFASGLLLRKLPPRAVLLMAACCIAAGFAAASRIQTLRAFFICYGVLVGFGIGLTYNAVISTGVKWFPEKPGMASGMMLMGFGLGGMALGTICAAMIASLGWRTTFLGLGVVYGALLLLSAFVIAPPPKNASFPAPPGRKAARGPELAAAQMLKRPSFWILFVWTVMLSSACLAVINNASPMAMDMGASASTAALFTGMISLFNGGSRVITGILYDRLSFRAVMSGTALAAMAALACTIAALNTGALPLLALAFALTGVSFGGITPTSSTLANTFYGAKHYAVNYSVLNLSLIASSFLGPFLTGSLQSVSGSFMGAAVVMLVFGAAGLVLAQTLRKP